MNSNPELLLLDALAALKARLETMTNPKPKRIFADPAEAVSLGDFPCVVLSLDPDRKDHTFFRKAVGVYHYRFYVAIWVFVGSRQTPLGELHRRALLWPVPMGVCLLAGQRINNSVSWSGEGGATGQLFSHDIGNKFWADGEYFGLKFSLPLSIALPTAFG